MTDPRLSVGDPAPLFELPDTDGTLVRLEPVQHAATVVVFTANGCPYARAWHDRIQQVARDVADRDVAVLQLVSNDETDHVEDSAAAMAERVAAGEVAGPFLRDADQATARAYGATATPEVFVIDRAGVVRYHGAPDGDYDNPALDASWVREALDDVLAGREVRRSTTSVAGCSIKWRVELLWWEGCPTHGRGRGPAAADARGAGQGRGARRPPRGAHPCRGPAARLPGVAHVPGRRARPVPDRRRAGPDVPGLPARGRSQRTAARRRRPRGTSARCPGPSLGAPRLGRLPPDPHRVLIPFRRQQEPRP